MSVRHYQHHYHFSYTTSLKRHFLSTVVVLTLVVVSLLLILRSIFPTSTVHPSQFSIEYLLLASLFTFLRLSVAYVVALVVSVPLALLITSSPKAEKVFLPFFDILQSIPVLAFFPVIVLAFIQFKFFEGAAIFVLFIDMIWNIAFTMVGGLKAIPDEIKLASDMFQAKGFNKLWHVTLPAIVPYIITGSLLAWGQGWNIIIVAEVLHNYLPNGSPQEDLFGLGSLLVNAIASGQTVIFISALVTMILIIGIMNFFIWQKLLRLTQRFKFG